VSIFLYAIINVANKSKEMIQILLNKGAKNMNKGKALIFSDEKIMALYLRNLLEKLGYKISGIVFAPEEIEKVLKVESPDFILVNLSGDSLTENTLNTLVRKYDVPFIFVGLNSNLSRKMAANNVLSYVSRGPSEEELENAIETAMRAGNMYRNLKESYKKLQSRLDETIKVISLIVEKKDLYTAGHQLRVAKIAEKISKKIGMDKERTRYIYTAGLLHDVGKIAIPSEILTKPAKLTEIEMEFVKTHPGVGYEILSGISFEYPIAEIILQHHERLDGSGYPQGLKGEEILFDAQIIAVADVVEAISSHRPYRPALGIEHALNEINSKKGILYIPEIVEVCIELFEKDNFKL